MGHIIRRDTIYAGAVFFSEGLEDGPPMNGCYASYKDVVGVFHKDQIATFPFYLPYLDS